MSKYKKNKLLNFESYNENNSISRNSHIDSIESFYLRYPDENIEIYFNNKLYNSENYTKLIDSLVSTAVLTDFKNWRKLYLQPQYEEDNNFRILIDEMDDISTRKYSYYSNESERIKERILNILNPVKKIKALLHFSNEYQENFNNGIFKNFFWTKVNEIAETAPRHLKANSLEVIGDFYLSNYEIASALNAYYRSLLMYDSLDNRIGTAEILEKIGNTFSVRNSVPYILKASHYFKWASLIYSEMTDKESALKLKLRSSAAGINLYDHNYEDINKDMIRNDFLLDLNKFNSYRANSKSSSSILNYELLGYFFSWKNESLNLISAIKYYQIAILLSFNDKKDIDIYRIINHLNTIARIYSRIGNPEETNKYLEYGFKLAKMDNNIYNFKHQLLNKAICLNNLGQFEEGLKIAWAGIDTSNNYQNYNYTEHLLKRGYSTLSLLYNTNKNLDSANIYSSKYWALESRFLKELDYIYSLENSTNLQLIAKRIDSVIYESDEIIKSKNNEIEIKEKNLSLLNDSLNRMSDSLNWKKKELTEISSIIKSREETLKQLEGKIYDREVELSKKDIQIKDRELYIILISVLSTIAIIFTFLYFRRRQKVNQEERQKENALSKLKILNNQLKNHELKEISMIMDVKTKQLFKSIIQEREALNPSILSSASDLKKYVDLANKYIQEYYRSSKEITTTIKAEIELAEIWIELFKLKYRLNENSIKFICNIDLSSEKANISVPTHSINNFIMNSIKHGKVDGKEISVMLNCVDTNIGYKISIEDDGCGINQSIKVSNHKEGSGIQLVIDSIEAYNKIIDNQFKILFNKSNIIDKADLGDGNGTIVIIDIVKSRA